MHRLSAAAGLVAFSLLPLALAGPYSPGAGVSGAIDAGIPGFVGPDGDGVAVSGGSNVINPLFAAWATEVISYTPAPGVDTPWLVPSTALGPVTADYLDIVALGDLSQTQIDDGVQPGSIVLAFASGIRNGAGADFAVFENGLGAANLLFCELAYVEVSSNGVDFARFPSISLTDSPLSAYASLDPTNVYNLAGKHANGNDKSWGTPFDLEDLVDHPLVTGGLVDLDTIMQVRFVDIPGTGHYLDSTGAPIYDPSVTWGSGGFDLEAVGVIHTVPEPSIALISTLGALLLTRRRQVRL